MKAIQIALSKQYEKCGHAAWLQESKSQKVLLIDDVDAHSISHHELSKCLEGMFSYFSGVILTGKDGAAAMDILSIDRVEALSKCTQYEIREFGHKKRFELVCKWAEIGGKIDESSEKWMSTIDKWERDLTAAVGRQFIPSVPIFLLTLLQSMESGRTSDLQNSAFGHYYHFLITSALKNVGIERDQWNEVMNYCANLAWFIRSLDVFRISENKLENFNAEFSKEFTPVSFDRRMRNLIDAGILSKADDEIEFKYPYLMYYFLGQYIADRIHEAEIEQYIIKLCGDLHLSENANILLFASHHTKSPVIYERIVGALDSCFADEIVFDFERDVAMLNQLVGKAPQLVYQEAPTKISRSGVRERQDLIDETKVEDAASETDIAAAITRLFRGMEILGQFLKNHYGSTKSSVKEELIIKLIQGALRGLHSTTASLIEDSEAMAKHVERILDERKSNMTPDETSAYAKRIVFDIIGMISFGFVQKAGSAVASVYLKDNLNNVADRENSLGYSFIEMSYLLDLPEQIPFSKIHNLNQLVKQNVFSRALLRSMALRHLHLFKVSYKDKQRLCSELDISLEKQFSIQNELINKTKV